MSEARQNPAAEARLLIVEDDPHICELMSDILRDEGFEPVCVQSDRGAYEALEHQRDFACMVVDVNLGSGTTGYDVARFARRTDPELAVIYVSGQTSKASFEANGVPGSLFLEKPFTARDVLERLRKLVGDNDA
jgi:DNA-binding response OmpR family regulator